MSDLSSDQQFVLKWLRYESRDQLPMQTIGQLEREDRKGTLPMTVESSYRRLNQLQQVKVLQAFISEK